MKKGIRVAAIALMFVFGMTGFAHATLLQITAESASNGELGWFVVDDAVLTLDQSLQAAQFEDYYWNDPLSSLVITPADVPGDTGYTYFAFLGGVWTVAGGGGDSLTSPAGALWIAGSSYVSFYTTSFWNGYSDVTWNTTEYNNSNPVPEPSTMLLLGSGLLGLVGLNRRRKA